MILIIFTCVNVLVTVRDLFDGATWLESFRTVKGHVPTLKHQHAALTVISDIEPDTDPETDEWE